MVHLKKRLSKTLKFHTFHQVNFDQIHLYFTTDTESDIIELTYYKTQYVAANFMKKQRVDIFVYFNFG